ncbi:YraN family protein [Geothermobacter hydrogeniphilus]|uniref:UPF0102 protein C2E25_09030 n=1 Tax=Geothermobacter hydrogeniphilus TaxID=1969733 RepID=A0A2K2HA03_9BACT|nr:YraN family protein [Geothermobacter hydrogeniphilus]PNU20049.1 YraN family protein [Geothermobacter hydrogeniphilus]
MTEERLALGRWGEEQAVLFLRRQGFRILERNYRTRVGEIDIIARNRRLLLFVEVKTRRGQACGLPQEAVGIFKQRQIIRTAQWYLNNQLAGRLQPRFDVIAVRQWRDEAFIEHLPNAFGLDF